MMMDILKGVQYVVKNISSDSKLEIEDRFRLCDGGCLVISNGNTFWITSEYFQEAFHGINVEIDQNLYDDIVSSYIESQKEAPSVLPPLHKLCRG